MSFLEDFIESAMMERGKAVREHRQQNAEVPMPAPATAVAAMSSSTPAVMHA